MDEKTKDYLKRAQGGAPLPAGKAKRLIEDGLLTRIGGAGRGLTAVTLTEKGREALAAG